MLIDGIAAAAVLALAAAYAYSVTNSRPEVETAIAEHAELTATVSASGTLAPASGHAIAFGTARSMTRGPLSGTPAGGRSDRRRRAATVHKPLM